MCTNDNGTGSFRKVKYFTNLICSSKNHISGIKVNNCEPFCAFPIHTMLYQISVPAQKLRAVGDSLNVTYNQVILFSLMINLVSNSQTFLSFAHLGHVYQL